MTVIPDLAFEHPDSLNSLETHTVSDVFAVWRLCLNFDKLKDISRAMIVKKNPSPPLP